MGVEKAKGGFTLVEMAVVLVIIGLILTVTLPLLTEGIKRDKLTKGRQGISSLRDEIIGYALTHDGVLPTLNTVANLASAEDPWGNLIAYWSDPDITEGAATDICTLSSAPNNLSLLDNNAGSTYTGVAFIIASRGADHNLQVGYSAGPPVEIATYANGVEIAVADDVVHGVATGLTAGYDVAGARANRFDDVVQYVTFNYLRTRICTPEFGDEKAHAAVTFDNISDNFATPPADGTGASYANTNGAVAVDTASDSVSLGNENTGAVGCLWWAGTNASLCGAPDGNGNNIQSAAGLCQNGTAWKKARFVFKFSVASTDESTTSNEERGGFTFTMAGVDTSTHVNDGGLGTGGLASAMCGNGESANGWLGYTGYYPNGVSTGVPRIERPKYAVEVDLYCGGQGDPTGISMSGSLDPTTGAATGLSATEYPNHVAAVHWGATIGTDDNTHGAGVTAGVDANPDWTSAGTGAAYSEYIAVPPDLTADGFMSNATHRPGLGAARTHWLEDAKDHWIRIVFDRSGASLVTHIWIADSPSAAFKNVGADNIPQDPHGQVGYALYENSTTAPLSFGGITIDNFRFGWTTATGGSSPTTIILSDFAFNLGI